MSAKKREGGIDMIKPLYDRLLLEKVEVVKETSSGILLPESTEDSSSMAKVVAKGEGRITDSNEIIPLPVEIGDTVIYKEYATTDIKYEGKEYMLIEMKDILAIVEGE